MTGLSEQQLAEVERLRERVAELETYAYGCDAEGCVLPHSSWCEAAKKSAAKNDGCTCGQSWQGHPHPQPHAMHCWAVNPPRNEIEEMRKRIAELLAERHQANEWLEDAAKALRAKDERIAELENAGPSRFTATPAEVDVHLRTVLAEDTYLTYQRAIGDAVLDEIQTSGKTFRAGQEAEHAKHVYLAGMDDVLTAIWDDRYYPAKLLCSQHNGFGPCPGAPWCKPEAVTRHGR